MARLDRLAPVKEVAQIAAVIECELSPRLLAAVEPINGQPATALDQLVASELVFRRGMPPAVTYSLSTPWSRMLPIRACSKSRRQQLHTTIVHVLEEQFSAVTLTQPELLAHHCTVAQFPDRAINYWLLAGKRASRRSDRGGGRSLAACPRAPRVCP
jgi:predicted ATPase